MPGRPLATSNGDCANKTADTRKSEAIFKMALHCGPVRAAALFMILGVKPFEDLLRIQGGGPFLINSFLVRKVLCALWWLLPSAFALYTYRDGLLAWFQQDDFVWLRLLSTVHDAKDLAVVLFTPA